MLRAGRITIAAILFALVFVVALTCAYRIISRASAQRALSPRQPELNELDRTQRDALKPIRSDERKKFWYWLIEPLSGSGLLADLIHYGSSPYAVSCPREPTKTFPFATSGTLNLVAKSNMSREPIWSLL